MEDESGDQFVAYFLPSDDTLLKRKREEDDPSEIASEDELVFILYLDSCRKILRCWGPL